MTQGTDLQQGQFLELVYLGYFPLVRMGECSIDPIDLNQTEVKASYRIVC